MKAVGQPEQRPTVTQQADLLRAIGATRDRDAFVALFGYFTPRVKGYLMRSGAAPDEADEVAQETMLAVWRKAERFDPERAAVSTWIFTIARNLRIDRHRRGRRASTLTLDPSDEAENTPSHEDIAIVAERDAKIRAVLASMPGDQAEIVRMSFYSEKSHAEIARVLKIPLGTVKSRIRRAIDRLRQMLDGAL